MGFWETTVLISAAVCFVAIWRAEQVDKARLANEQIRWEKDYQLRMEQMERNEYILEAYRDLLKNGRI